MKLLNQEISRAELGRKVFKDELETDRSKFSEKVGPELMPSIVSSIRREKRNQFALVHEELMEKLINCQRDRIDHCRYNSNVVIMDGGELPVFVLDVLSLKPEGQMRDKFNEVHFIAETDKLVPELPRFCRF